MPKQSTNHVLLIRPAEFFSNDQTALTNQYQHLSQEKDKDKIQYYLNRIIKKIKIGGNKN